MISLPWIDMTCAHQDLVFLVLFPNTFEENTLTAFQSLVASPGSQASEEVTSVPSRAKPPRADLSSLCFSPSRS